MADIKKRGLDSLISQNTNSEVGINRQEECFLTSSRTSLEDLVLELNMVMTIPSSFRFLERFTKTVGFKVTEKQY